MPRSFSKCLGWENCLQGVGLTSSCVLLVSIPTSLLPAQGSTLHPCPEPSTGLIPVAPGGSQGVVSAAARMRGRRPGRLSSGSCLAELSSSGSAFLGKVFSQDLSSKGRQAERTPRILSPRNLELESVHLERQSRNSLEEESPEQFLVPRWIYFIQKQAG